MVQHQQENKVSKIVYMSNQDLWATTSVEVFGPLVKFYTSVLSPCPQRLSTPVASFLLIWDYNILPYWCYVSKMIFNVILDLQRHGNTSHSPIYVLLNDLLGRAKRTWGENSETDGQVVATGVCFRSDWEARTFDSSSWLHQSSGPACTLEALQKIGLRKGKKGPWAKTRPWVETSQCAC